MEKNQSKMIAYTKVSKINAKTFINKHDLSIYDFKDQSLDSIKYCQEYLEMASNKKIDIENIYYGNIIKYKIWKYWKDIIPKTRREGYVDPIDCDKDPNVMNLFCVLLDYSCEKIIGYKGRKIYFDNNMVVETETINSLDSILNCFFRALVLKIWNSKMHDLFNNGMLIENGQLKKKIEENDLLKNNAYDRDVWLILCIDEMYKIMIERNMQQELKELKLLNEFALLIHSFGNFCVLPVGANFESPLAKAKCICKEPIYGQRISDDIFTFIYRLQNDIRYQSWNTEFEFYKNIEDMDIYYNVQYCNSGKSLEEYYLKQRIDLIKKRGKSLTEKLNRFINEDFIEE